VLIASGLAGEWLPLVLAAGFAVVLSVSLVISARPALSGADGDDPIQT